MTKKVMVLCLNQVPDVSYEAHEHDCILESANPAVPAEDQK